VVNEFRREALQSDPSAGEARFFELQAPVFPVRIAEIEQIRLQDMHALETGIVEVGLFLYGDGSPYVFEEDLAAGVDFNLYGLVVSPESPPFLAPTSGAVEGRPSYRLDDPDCEQIVQILRDPRVGGSVPPK
jgi:hypothetical protein